MSGIILQKMWVELLILILIIDIALMAFCAYILGTETYKKIYKKYGLLNTIYTIIIWPVPLIIVWEENLKQKDW